MKDFLIEIVILTFLIAFIGSIPFYLNYSFDKKDKEWERKKARKV